MRVAAPAKVNLFLGVGGLRADGFHAVTTVLHTLELGDEVTIEPSGSLEVSCDADVGVPPESNLAHRAATEFATAVGRQPSVRIALKKAIPHGAGLGGGSADAAAVIRGLASHWGIDTGDPRILRVAAALGADVPFFLSGSPAALMTGRGDALERPLAGIPGLPVAIVKPRAPVPTAAAYRAFDAAPLPAGDPAAVLDALAACDPEALASALANNLHSAACTVVADVARVLDHLRRWPGVRGALLAGSGSAVFALCEDDTCAAALADDASGRGWWSAATRLGAHGARLL